MQLFVGRGERRIARPDILVADAPGAPQVVVRERHRIEMRACSRTDSYHSVLLIAACCNASEPGRRRRSKSASSAGTSPPQACHASYSAIAVLHREPRARADRRMTGAQRVPEQHDVAPVPVAVADDRVAEPVGTVGQQRLCRRDRRGTRARSRRGSAPRSCGRGRPRANVCGSHLDEERAVRAAVAVGVRDQQAVARSAGR